MTGTGQQDLAASDRAGLLLGIAYGLALVPPVYLALWLISRGIVALMGGAP